MSDVTTGAQPYHHGNLRDALVDAACAAVAEQGHEALSLRSLAEAAGVARSAPYRHFPDKDALLAAVALRGFEQLRRDLLAIGSSPDSPRGRLLLTGRTFLRFVQGNPQMFRLMYEAQLINPDSPFPALADGMAETYRLLDQLYQQYAPEPSPARRQMRMITLWSTLYGYARIRQGALLQPYMMDALTEDEIEASVLEFMIGPAPR